MSRTPRDSGDDPTVAAPVGADASVSSRPIAINLDEDARAVGGPSRAKDDELLARDAQAARDVGDLRRVDGLVCARALLAERQGDDEAAMALWRSAFDHDPSLLVAFWGLRRALARQGAWADLQGVLERRIAATSSIEQGTARAALWLDHGRIAEDRLGRDEDAAQSYHAGLIEAPDHPGLLTSLLLLGFRRADDTMIAHALQGYLRGGLPPFLRASIAASLARIQRGSRAAVSGHLPFEAESSEPDLDPMAAARALETLRTALRVVERQDAGALVTELFALANATAEPASRAEILNDLVSHLPLGDGTTTGDNTSSTGDSATTGDSTSTPGQHETARMAVSLLRERARLLRDHLHDPAAAGLALRAALARAPGHPAVIAELCDVIEVLAGEDTTRSVTGLRDLLALVAPGDRPFQTDAEGELALRTLAALGRQRQSEEALALLERHPELARDRADVFALEILLRAQAGDTVGLAAAFEREGEALAQGGGDGSPATLEAAAHALVVAGTLRERNAGRSPSDGARDVESEPTRLYRRALEVAPDYAPARDAVERRLWATGRWRDIADLLRSRLKQLADARAETDAAFPPRREDAVDVAEASRLLEDLVALYRDHLDDPGTARRYQDELIRLEPDSSRGAGGAGARAWVRRHDLELAAAVHGDPSDSATRVGILRELSSRAGVPVLESALLVEAARVAVSGDDPAMAEDLLRKAMVADGTGTAASGLERLVTGADLAGMGAARAAVVRAEISRLVAGQEMGQAKTERLRALRFRLAWHALAADRPAEALEALGPLRADGDLMARAWSWEIARRSGDARLRLATLQAAPAEHASGLVLPADLGEAHELAGAPRAAGVAFSEALRTEFSTDAALGLLRVGAVTGDARVILEAGRALAAHADDATALPLSREVALLALLHGEEDGGSRGIAGGQDDEDEPMDAVLRWVAGLRAPEVLGAAAGLLAVARALPDAGAAESANDRNGLLARAAARARLGGTQLAGAVHDQVATLSAGAAPIGVGLADLPVAGRPERIAARIARAERNGGPLAYALDLERAEDAEARGEGAEALDGFAYALRRDPEGIEALEGIKRLALATGDRLGAARAGMRLGMVLRVPARAAAEFGVAGQIFEDLGLLKEARIAFWQALAREPGSVWLYERLRQLLGGERDGVGLDRLYGHRLATLPDPEARIALLLERARHRMEHLDDRKAAIEDFKRILKIDPRHEPALRQLATLAMQMEYFTQAVRFLDRLLALQVEEHRVAALCLELAEAHEAAREPARAIEVLRRAVSARPRDVAPWQRLIDLLLRIGDWSGALAALRSWDAVLADPVAKAAIWVRMGCLLRDHGRDGLAAFGAFVTASDLDPLSDGIRELVALGGPARNIGERRQTLGRVIIRLRQTLAADPLDVPRLRRLKEAYEWLAQDRASVAAADAPDAAPDVPPAAVVVPSEDAAAVGASITGQLLALAGEEGELLATPRYQVRGTLSADFWSRLRAPGAGGFVADIWAVLAPAASELFPPKTPRPSHRVRVTSRVEPRLAWVEAAAIAVGLPAIELWMSRDGAGDIADESVTPIEGNAPALFLGRGALAGNAVARFRVGRTLSLLRDRAVALERMTAADVGTFLAAAAVIAGVSPHVPPDSVADIQERARVLGKAMSRKDRKSLELAAARFGFEPIDAVSFRESVLTTSDRLGFFMAGDIAVAVRVAGDFDPAWQGPLTTAVIVERSRLMALIRFALSDDYLMSRHESDAGAD